MLGWPFSVGAWEQSRLATRLALAQRLDDCGPRSVEALRAMEPWVSWDGPTLEARAKCYAHAGLPELTERARQDLNEYLDQQPQRLAR